MESTKNQFNNLARLFVKSFTDQEKEIYRESVVDKYTPEQFSRIVDYIHEDKMQRRFPTPIEFSRAANVVIEPEKKVDISPDVSPEQREACMKFVGECIKNLADSWHKGV